MMDIILERMAKRIHLPSADKVLPGRTEAIIPSEPHAVLGSSMIAPFPESCEVAVFALGCFWGAERAFWRIEGVYVTAVGYVAGTTPNPTYEEVCSGLTGHTEAVLVVYDPALVSFDALLRTFWESHDPTQGMRQGNDVGTQYRSGIYVDGSTQLEAARLSFSLYSESLKTKGLPEITTEISKLDVFYYAEDYHQQYLHKNPNGYCGLGGLGVAFPG